MKAAIIGFALLPLLAVSTALAQSSEPAGGFQTIELEPARPAVSAGQLATLRAV